jgi:c-di-GMP-binding flagellar brake protein YcgR
MYTTADRRTKPRISCDYPGLIETLDDSGKRIHAEGKLVNLSAGGLYMLVNHNLEKGTKLSITIYLTAATNELSSSKLVTNGVVVRNEPRPSGQHGIAVMFQNYHFQ